MSSHSGFYHNPPIWVGSNPVHPEEPLNVDFDRLSDEVFSGSIANKVGVRVCRDGLFRFDFSGFGPGVEIPRSDGVPDFDELASAIIFRTSVMNAFLACLYTSTLNTKGAELPDRMVITPDLYISFRVNREGKEEGLTAGSPMLMHLLQARYPSTYQPDRPPIMDSRLSNRSLIPESALESACAEATKLVGDEVNGVVLADLFLRASKAFQEHFYSLALTSSWTLTERMISVLWKRYLADNRVRNGAPFINSERLKRLNDNRSYTASVMSEILSLADRIPFETYVKMNDVRQARNGWIHSMSPVGRETASVALSLCSEMLDLVHGFKLNGDQALRLTF